MKTAAWIAGAVLALLLFGAGAYAVHDYRNLSNQVAELQPLKDQVAQLQTQQKSLTEQFIARNQQDQSIRETRQAITTSLQQVSISDPQARDYLGQRIPGSVRAAYLAAESAAGH